MMMKKRIIIKEYSHYMFKQDHESGDFDQLTIMTEEEHIVIRKNKTDESIIVNLDDLKKLIAKYEKDIAEGNYAIDDMIPPKTRKQKAQVMVEAGYADSMEDAYAQLEDMGE